jgi:hypothetical protein
MNVKNIAYKQDDLMRRDLYCKTYGTSQHISDSIVSRLASEIT